MNISNHENKENMQKKPKHDGRIITLCLDIVRTHHSLLQQVAFAVHVIDSIGPEKREENLGVTHQPRPMLALDGV